MGASFQRANESQSEPARDSHQPQPVRPVIANHFGKSLLQRQPRCACGGNCPRCQTKTGPATLSETGDKRGNPLDSESRSFFEPRLGRDLSQVRVHNDPLSNNAAQEMQARAFTVGQEIHFAAGEFNPASPEGRSLLAHELVHTIQQGVPQAAQPKLEISQPNDAAEIEADRVAGAIVNGVPASVSNPYQAAPNVAREPAAGAGQAAAEKPADAVTLTDDKLKDANKFNERVAGNLKQVGKDWVPRDPALPPPQTIDQAQFFLDIPLARPRRGRYKMTSGIYVPQDALKEYQKDHPRDDVDTNVPLVEGVWADVLPPLSEAVARWQAKHNKELSDQSKALPVDGKLTKQTVDEMKTKGLAETDKVMWQVRDQIDWSIVRAEEMGARFLSKLSKGDAGVTRQAIVSLAEQQIGQVYAADRGDQKKYGWERILRYYQVAFGGEDDLSILSQKLQEKLGKDAKTLETDKSPEATELRERQTQQGKLKSWQFDKAPSPYAIEKGEATAPTSDPWKRIQATGQFAFPTQGPWSWCGIFTMWAVKAVTGQGYWNARPSGLTEVKKDNDKSLAGAKPGDILAMRTSNSHFCLLAAPVPPNATPATKLHTIDGNVEVQSVAASDHWTVEHVGSYFKAIDDAAPQAPDPPASPVQGKAAAARESDTEEKHADPGRIRGVAVEGVRQAGSPLPYLDQIQKAFGNRDLSGVRAHIDSESARSAQAIGASAYTVGDRVAFDGPPNLSTAAHEAAHVIQQRAGIHLDHGVGRAGDRFERHADAVAARVVGGYSAEDLLAQPESANSRQTTSSPPVQREAAKKGIKDAAMAAQITSTIDVGLEKIDESLTKGTKTIRLAIRGDDEFDRAWDDYCDRSGRPGASQGGVMTGFVDTTHPNGKTGFVRASADISTAIHEAMHLRADPGFFSGKVGVNINEGTTELFTRIVIAYAGGNIERTVYEQEKTAMLRLQGISGLTALAQWYFHNDRSAVDKALGSKLEQFMYWMDSAEIVLDVAGRTESAIKAL
jgi:hypothetical protein